MNFMERSPFPGRWPFLPPALAKALALTGGLLCAALPLAAQERLRILDPPDLSGPGQGWSLNPGTGALQVRLDLGEVPGEVAVPSLDSGYRPLTGYTGHLRTELTGLISMKGRFYSPAWHRFLNSDQGADPNQQNAFAYCGGNPLVAMDPTGLIQTHPDNVRGTRLVDADTSVGHASWGSGLYAPEWVMGNHVTFDTVQGNQDALAYADSGGRFETSDSPAPKFAKGRDSNGNIYVFKWVDGGRLQERYILNRMMLLPGQVLGGGWSVMVDLAQNGQGKTWNEYFSDRMAAPGQLARDFGVPNGVVGAVGKLTVAGGLKGGWSVWKFGRAYGLGSNASALSTLVSFGGTSSAFGILSQVEQAVNPIAMGLIALQVGYAAGSAAGALGDVIADNL